MNPPEGWIAIPEEISNGGDVLLEARLEE